MRLLGWAAPALLLALVVWWWVELAIFASPADWAWDFQQIYHGATGVLEGVSPYRNPDVPVVVDGEAGGEVVRYAYPPTAAVLFAPFTVFGFSSAAAVWSAVSIVALFASAWLLGVRTGGCSPSWSARRQCSRRCASGR
jgi:hypothetical protein